MGFVVLLRARCNFSFPFSLERRSRLPFSRQCSNWQYRIELTIRLRLGANINLLSLARVSARVRREVDSVNIVSHVKCRRTRARAHTHRLCCESNAAVILHERYIPAIVISNKGTIVLRLYRINRRARGFAPRIITLTAERR